MSVSGILSSVMDNVLSSQTQNVQSQRQQFQQEFQQLGQDLESGNLSAAQSDYSTIQQDFQNQAQSQGAHMHHHHHHGGGAEASAMSQEFQQLGQALQSGNMSNAQQAYASLQQDFEQFAGSGTQSGSSAQSTSPSISVTA